MEKPSEELFFLIYYFLRLLQSFKPCFKEFGALKRRQMNFKFENLKSRHHAKLELLKYIF